MRKGVDLIYTLAVVPVYYFLMLTPVLLVGVGLGALQRAEGVDFMCMGNSLATMPAC